MLSKALMSSSFSRIALVASKTASFSGSGYASSSISLSDLPIQAGDLIVFTSSSYVLTTTTISVTGYTSAYSTQDLKLRAATFYKTATSLESSINFEWTGNTAAVVSCVVAVFRGYQYNSRTTSVFSGSGFTNPPSISCAIGDLILATGHTDFGYSSVTVPSGYKLVKNAFATDGTNGTATQMFYKIAESTSEDPDSILIGYTSTWIAATIRCTPV